MRDNYIKTSVFSIYHCYWLLDSLIFFDLHSNNHTLAEVLEQLNDITPTLSKLKADHLLSHLITASYFVTCT
jgi:hypothetical protein